MALEPELVAIATNLYLEAPLPQAQLEELARLLDNREELFAYLLTRDSLLEKHPDIRDEVRRLALEHGSQALTRRQVVGPLAATRNLVQQLQEELLSSIAGSVGETSSTSKLDELEHQLTHYSSIGPGHSNSPERWIKT